jgi:hypothetical protein
MILTELKIELERFGENKGKHTGRATFTGEAGTVILKLNQHHIEQIFLTCADSITETAKAAARHLTMTVLEHRKELENKP